MKSVTISGILLLWNIALAAQIFNHSEFPRIDLKDLHPRNIMEDSRDFMWLGTEAGLHRFDGFEVEMLPFENHLEDDEVTAIFEDQNQVIWVGYRTGHIGFLDTDTIRSFEFEEGHPNAPITGIALIENGQLWFSTYGEGLYVYDRIHLYNFDTGDGISSNDIYGLQVDSSGRIWICTDQGLNICQWEKGQKKIHTLSTKEGVPDEIILNAAIDPRSGELWFGTHDKGIARVDHRTEEVFVPIEEWTYGPVKAVCIKDNSLVIGTEGNGIFSLDLKTFRLSEISDSNNDLMNTRIWDVITDREGNIWVLNDGTGISLIKDKITTYPIEGLDIQAMHLDEEHGIWLGTSAGLYLYSLAAGKIVSFGPSDMNIISFHQDGKRNLWIGTFGDGIYLFNPKLGFIKHLHEGNVLINNSVLSISGLEDTVWIATLGGAGEIILSYPRGQAVPFITQMSLVPGMGANFIYRTYIDRHKQVWFGSDGQGLFVRDKGVIRSIPGSKQDIFRVIYDLVQDNQNRIWFITGSNTLGLLANDSIEQVTLPAEDLELVRIAIDSDTNIVIVHSEGIMIVDPEDHHILSIDSEYGLNNPNAGLTSMTSDKYGNLWFANTSNLFRYTPFTGESASRPRARIKYIQALSEKESISNKLVFKPGENVLSFHYTGLWYSNPEKVNFRYMIDGYDPDWKLSSDRTATYAKLPPGEYIFKVQASLTNRFSHSSTASIQFRILPPFYQRMWFMGLASVTVLFSLYSFIKNKENQIKKKMAMEKEIITYQYESLNNQVNPHFLFNSFNTLLSIIEEKPSLATEYLEKLSDFYRGVLVYREKEIISLKEELSLIYHYTYLLKKRYGKNFSFDIRFNDFSGFVAPLTIQMLIENAIKHNIISNKYPLHVELIKLEDHLVISNNLQKKKVPDSSTKFGLRNIKARYAILTKMPVEIEETDAKFQVKIPILKNKLT